MLLRLKTLFRIAWSAIRPGPLAVRGAGTAILVVAALVYSVFVVMINIGPLPFFIPVVIAMLLLGGLLAWLGQGLAKLIELLAKVPWPLRWTLLAGILLVNIAFMSFPTKGLLAVTAFVVLASGLFGAGMASLRQNHRLTRIQRLIAAAGAAAGGLALLGGLGAYTAWRGQPAAGAVDAARQSGAPLVHVALPDPSQPGPFPVQTMAYGSGDDRYRPEYGKDVDVVTGPVDGSKLLDGSWKDFGGQLRELAWGFGPSRLPLNGRAWFPEGDGPFPLVVFVHGNHMMMDFSDPGYAYLGELLASRGIIFVSVDENFLNGSATDLFDSFSGENDARGWLLLEHLRLWKLWNSDPNSSFYNKVDLDNLALGGHSRGGEAAAVAAAFNRLPALPENFSMAFHYGFNIRAVVAIAPVDGQYSPGQRGTSLSGVNYFVLHGSHDADLTSFDGLDLYERVDLAPGSGSFKSALYVYRANHGQFNTTWGDSDPGPFAAGLLDRTPLLDPSDQQQVARLYISAFLAASLQGQDSYLPLFQDTRAAPAGWLPETVYINRYDQAGDRLIAGFDEDADITSPSIPGGVIRGTGFDHWYEKPIHSKYGGRESNAVYLGWNEDTTPAYTLTLRDRALPKTGAEFILFQLADANQDPGHAAGFELEKGQKEPARLPVDLTIQLEDQNGETAKVTLGAYRLVQPQLTAELYKLKLFQRDAPSEPILQSYALPLADFVKDNPAFNPAELKTIRFLFDKTRRGSLVLDGIGLR